MNLISHLQGLFTQALEHYPLEMEDLDNYLSMIRPTTDSKHGDYQANMAMPMAKKLKQKPQAIAQELIDKLPQNSILSEAVVAGPGFINLRIQGDWIARQITLIASDERLGVPKLPVTRKFVVDYSGPNVAKPLHVGHLRSTNIGDAIVRILRFLGHDVIGDNHLGDWGTQFGILIYGYKHFLDQQAYQANPVRELARLYVHVRQLAKIANDDEEESAKNDIMEACRIEAAKLHEGDPENLALWQEFMPACLEMLKPIYERLDVNIDYALGESHYHEMLGSVVDDLLTKRIAQESHNAIIILNEKNTLPEPGTDTENDEPPAIIRKRDGAYTYTTTDLATIKYRAETWEPDAMLYVVDKRQALHFRTLFANARRWGYDQIEFQHLQFGSIMGSDGKPLKTRDGGVPELMGLLDDAVAHARNKYQESNNNRLAQGHDLPELTPEEIAEIAEVVGVGAVKYRDLSNQRTSDYEFNLELMLSTDGNTATYMQYAYARCQSILRKGEIDEARLIGELANIIISSEAERLLLLQILRLENALNEAANRYEPHHITNYLWALAKNLNGFYENCKVLSADSDSIKMSRILLVNLVARTIKLCLNLLGIKTLEQM